MADLNLAEDSVQLVLRLLRDGLRGSEIKEFYDGDPDRIPSFNLPCIVVEQLKDDTTGGTFAEDDIDDTVQVRVIFNKKDDYASDLNPVDTTHTKVRRLIGARDATTGNCLPNTVKGALRPNVYGERRIGGDMTVDLGGGLRPDEQGITFASTEGHVTLHVLYSVDVNPADASA